MEESCRICQARLTPDVEWCPQCFTPVVAANPPEGEGITPQDTVPEPEAEGSPADGPRKGPPTSKLFLEARKDVSHAVGPEPDDVPTAYNPPEFSRWKAGPSSLGPAAKIAMSAVVILVLVGMFTVVHAIFYYLSGGVLMDANKLRIYYGIPACILGYYALSRIWRRTRIK